MAILKKLIHTLAPSKKAYEVTLQERSQYVLLKQSFSKKTDYTERFLISRMRSCNIDIALGIDKSRLDSILASKYSKYRRDINDYFISPPTNLSEKNDYVVLNIAKSLLHDIEHHFTALEKNIHTYLDKNIECCDARLNGEFLPRHEITKPQINCVNLFTAFEGEYNSFIKHIQENDLIFQRIHQAYVG